MCHLPQQEVLIIIFCNKLAKRHKKTNQEIFKRIEKENRISYNNNYRTKEQMVKSCITTKYNMHGLYKMQVHYESKPNKSHNYEPWKLSPHVAGS